MVIRCLLLLLAMMASQVVLAQRCNSIDDLQWLLGDWKSVDGAVATESWEKTSNMTYEGVTMKLSLDGKTRIDEQRLITVERDIFYLATVENSDIPIAYHLTQCLPNAAVFQNPQHSYPQQIIYQMTDVSTLRVLMGNGGSNMQTVNYQKQ